MSLSSKLLKITLKRQKSFSTFKIDCIRLFSCKAHFKVMSACKWGTNVNHMKMEDNKSFMTEEWDFLKFDWQLKSRDNFLTVKIKIGMTNLKVWISKNLVHYHTHAWPPSCSYFFASSQGIKFFCGCYRGLVNQLGPQLSVHGIFHSLPTNKQNPLCWKEKRYRQASKHYTFIINTVSAYLSQKLSRFLVPVWP